MGKAMVKILLSILVVIFMIIFISRCEKEIPQGKSIIIPKAKIVYIEAKDVESGIGSPPFGDAILMDIKNNKRIIISEDEFYDTAPYFSLGGDSILFQSNRTEDPIVRAIKGMSGPYDILLCNLHSLDLSNHKIFYEKDRMQIYKSTLFDLQFMTRNIVIFRFAGKNEIYSAVIDQDSTSMLKQFKQFDSIEDISHRDSIFVFGYNIKDSDQSGVALYDLRSDSTVLIMNDKWRIGGWYIDGSKILLFRNNVIGEYDFIKQEFREILKLKSEDKLIVRNPYYISEKEIVFLGRIKKTNTKNALENPFGNSEIYLYEIDKKQRIQVTNDGKEKDYLRGVFTK